MQLVVFVVASAMMLVGAVGVVTRRNPVHAALSLVLTLFGVAVHFVSLEAYFLAAVQVIVYAGAIVVLFLFVIMLLGVDKAEDLRTEPLVAQRWLAGVAALGLLGLLVVAAARGADCCARDPRASTPRSRARRVTRTSSNSPARCSVTTSWLSSSPRCCSWSPSSAR